jgi:hypothetical protein
MPTAGLSEDFLQKQQEQFRCADISYKIKNRQDGYREVHNLKLLIEGQWRIKDRAIVTLQRLLRDGHNMLWQHYYHEIAWAMLCKHLNIASLAYITHGMFKHVTDYYTQALPAITDAMDTLCAQFPGQIGNLYAALYERGVYEVIISRCGPMRSTGFTKEVRALLHAFFDNARYTNINSLTGSHYCFVCPVLIHDMAQGDYDSCAMYMDEFGASPWATDNTGKTGLALLIAMDHRFETGAEEMYRGNHGGQHKNQRPLMRRALAHADVARYINHAEFGALTPIHIACIRGQRALIKAFVASDADPELEWQYQDHQGACSIKAADMVALPLDIRMQILEYCFNPDGGGFSLVKPFRISEPIWHLITFDTVENFQPTVTKEQILTWRQEYLNGTLKLEDVWPEGGELIENVESVDDPIAAWNANCDPKHRVTPTNDQGHTMRDGIKEAMQRDCDLLTQAWDALARGAAFLWALLMCKPTQKQSPSPPTNLGDISSAAQNVQPPAATA